MEGEFAAGCVAICKAIPIVSIDDGVPVTAAVEIKLLHGVEDAPTEAAQRERRFASVLSFDIGLMPLPAGVFAKA